MLICSSSSETGDTLVQPGTRRLFACASDPCAFLPQLNGEVYGHILGLLCVDGEGGGSRLAHGAHIGAAHTALGGGDSGAGQLRVPGQAEGHGELGIGAMGLHPYPCF